MLIITRFTLTHDARLEKLRLQFPHALRRQLTIAVFACTVARKMMSLRYRFVAERGII